MFFKGKKSVSNQIDKHSNNIDKIITGLIIGGAAASILGLSKTKKGQEIASGIKNNSNGFFKKTYGLFGKSLVKIISIFNKKK